MNFHIVIVLSTVITLSQSLKSNFRVAFLSMEAGSSLTNFTYQSNEYGDTPDLDSNNDTSDKNTTQSVQYQHNSTQDPDSDTEKTDEDSTHNITLGTPVPALNQSEANTQEPSEEDSDSSHNITISAGVSSTNQSAESGPDYDVDEDESSLEYGYQTQGDTDTDEQDEDEWNIFLQDPTLQSTDSNQT